MMKIENSSLLYSRDTGMFIIKSNPKMTDWDKVLKVCKLMEAYDGITVVEECADEGWISLVFSKGFVDGMTEVREIYKEVKKAV